MRSDGQISAEHVTNNEAVWITPELHHKVYLKVEPVDIVDLIEVWEAVNG